MKNILIVLAAVIGINVSVNCQPINVPEVVKTAFKTMFPNATNVKWGKESAKEFEAEFKVNNNAVSANFKQDGSWVETESVIPIAELPQPVSAAIHTKYPGAPITMAEKTEQPGGKLHYEVMLKVNGKKKGVEVNQDGSFLK